MIKCTEKINFQFINFLDLQFLCNYKFIQSLLKLFKKNFNNQLFDDLLMAI